MDYQILARKFMISYVKVGIATKSIDFYSKYDKKEKISNIEFLFHLNRILVL